MGNLFPQNQCQIMLIICTKKNYKNKLNKAKSANKIQFANYKPYVHIPPKEEDPYEAALRIENSLHHPKFAKAAQMLWVPTQYNAWLTQLPLEEQSHLIEKVHKDCNCNRNFISIPALKSLPEAKQTMLSRFKGKDLSFPKQEEAPQFSLNREDGDNALSKV